jgi:hypothetical protein
MVVDATLLMLGAFLLTVLHLRKRVGSAIGFLAAASLFIASSGISLFTGGFSECAMCMMIAVMMVLLDRTSILSPWQLCLLVLAGLGLVASKLYAAPFVLLLALLLADRRQKIVYSAIFIIAPFLWLAIQSEVRAAAPAGMLDFYVSLMRGHGLRDALAFYLSLSFGVLPCFPFLFLVVFSGTERRFAVTIKILAIISVSALLLPFSFWAGPGGLAGPRYIAPFLLIFLPEVAEALRRFAQSRRRHVLLLIPATALLFLPCLEFRNSLVTRYANDERSVEFMPWPHTELAMHPAVMAWSVVAAKLEQRPVLEVSADMQMSIPVQDIFPMTTLSRVIYALTVKGDASPQIQTARNMLRQYHMDEVWPWAALRWLLAALLLGWLTVAAWPSRQQQ